MFVQAKRHDSIRRKEITAYFVSLFRQGTLSLVCPDYCVEVWSQLKKI